MTILIDGEFLFFVMEFVDGIGTGEIMRPDQMKTVLAL